MRYTKPPLSHDEQIDLLIERGLSIPDRDRFFRLTQNHRVDVSEMGFPADWRSRPLWA